MSISSTEGSTSPTDSNWAAVGSVSRLTAVFVMSYLLDDGPGGNGGKGGGATLGGGGGASDPTAQSDDKKTFGRRQGGTDDCPVVDATVVPETIFSQSLCRPSVKVELSS